MRKIRPRQDFKKLHFVPGLCARPAIGHLPTEEFVPRFLGSAGVSKLVSSG